MTAKELIQSLVDNAGFQIEQCCAGITEEQADLKVHEDAMSFRVTIDHLCECCVAAVRSAAGREHAWGTFKANSTTFAALLEEWRELRKVATDALVSDDDKLIGIAADFIVGHDYYHVGQLVSLRITFDKGWDWYSIYKH